MIEKTYEDTVATLKEVVSEFGPETVYRERFETGTGDCYYSINGCPACLVGQVLAKWGVLLPELDKDADNILRGAFAGEVLLTLQRQGILKVDDLSGNALSRVQSEQDAGQPWGEALRKAGIKL